MGFFLIVACSDLSQFLSLPPSPPLSLHEMLNPWDSKVNANTNTQLACKTLVADGQWMEWIRVPPRCSGRSGEGDHLSKGPSSLHYTEATSHVGSVLQWSASNSPDSISCLKQRDYRLIIMQNVGSSIKGVNKKQKSKELSAVIFKTLIVSGTELKDSK